MAILSNVPTLSYVSWKDMIITYEGQSYQIQNSYTMKPYIYWDYNNPYQLITSNEMLRELAGRFYIMFNDKGIYTLVPQTSIEINFADGISSDLIAEKILGFKEALENVDGEKFATIEQTVDGIKQTVGIIEEQVNGNTQLISTLQQTASDITAEINRVEREFNEDAQAKVLRDNISSAILNLQSVLGLFSSDMNSYMKDNRLTDIEKEEISIYKDTVETRELELNVYLDTIISMLNANGQVDSANTLATQKELLNTSISNLITNIDISCTDDMFTNTEMSVIISYFSNVNSKINETKNLVDKYIFLGVGGDLVEEIGKLTVKQDEISLSVSRTESSLKNSLNIEKSLIQGIINSNNTALVNFKNCFSVINEDREILPTEKDSLNIRIDNLNKNVTNITTKINEIVSNELLDEVEKDNLTDSHNIFIEKYNTMLNTVDEAIADDIVNDVELIEINKSIDEYYNQLNNLHSNMCLATDNIDINTTNKAIADAKAEIQIEIDDLNDKINNFELDVDDAIISGLIDKQEKDNITQNLEILEREKIDIDNRFNEWYNSEFLYGNLKSTYKQIYDTYIEKYNILVELSEKVANKIDYVSDEERMEMDNAEDEVLIALNNFLKESEIVVSTITSNEINYTKNNLLKEFSDISNALNNLNNQMNESFKDGIISELELKDIESILTQIDKEKMDIDKTYDEIYNNNNLN